MRGFACIVSALALVVTLAACGVPPSTTAAPQADAVFAQEGQAGGVGARLPPVVRFETRYDPDDVARCIDDRWSRLAALGAAEVSRHASFRGTMVDVRVGKESLARAQAEIYRVPGATVVDYFIRPAVTDPLEDLRLRALRFCLG